MKPVQPFDNFPSFANAGARQAPGDAKYSLGFVPADTLPAEWGNYFFHGATKGISDLNSATRSIWLEMNSVLEAENITPDADDHDQLLEALNKIKAEAILAAHPVGSLYWTSSTENPSITFGGGTWTQIKDKFILAAGDTYTNGSTGGAATVTLTTAQMPNHTHSVTAAGTVDSKTAGGSISGGAYKFTGSAVTSGENNKSHTHSFSAYFPVGFGFYGGSYYANNRAFPANQTSNVSLSSASWNDANANVVGGLRASYTEGTLQSRLTISGTSGVQSQNHTHSVTASGSISVTANPTFTGTSHDHTFTGTAVTSTATGGPSGATSGQASAHENMPPYIVKYCWERTA